MTLLDRASRLVELENLTNEIAEPNEFSRLVGVWVFHQEGFFFFTGGNFKFCTDGVFWLFWRLPR